MNAAKPIIGITTYLEPAVSGVWKVNAVFLPQVYLDAVTKAGAIAVTIPPQALEAGGADAILDRLDGLVIAGGKDVDARRYGQEPHPTADAPRVDRDELELQLLERALERDLPVLGICRGLQVLNVLRGGSLIQHLPDVIGNDRYNAGGGVFTFNPAEIVPGSRLHALVGDRLEVASYHHQAIDRLGDGLTVSARGDDGIIQAVDIDGASFGLAVQWHPEETAEDDRLFTALVAAASAYAARTRTGQEVPA